MAVHTRAYANSYSFDPSDLVVVVLHKTHQVVHVPPALLAANYQASLAQLAMLSAPIQLAPLELPLLLSSIAMLGTGPCLPA